MREAYIKKNFGADAIGMIITINKILNNYAEQGYDLSLRQLYYQLVSRNIVPNNEKSYKNVGNLVSDARLAGMIDWDMIKDRTREMMANPHWENPAEFMKVAAPQYRFDLWADQPNYVEVMVEKQALEGVLEPVCRRLDVPFTANRGYSSSSAMYEAAKRYLRRAKGDAKEDRVLKLKKELYVIYLGDHDPSGVDMTRDVLDRLDLFLKTDLCRTDEIGPNEFPIIEVRRIALNMDQIEDLRPPENPAKIKDSRAAEYIRKFGRSSWELDAIEPRELAALVERAIKKLMDVPLFDRNVKKLEAERKALLKFANEYKTKKGVK